MFRVAVSSLLPLLLVVSLCGGRPQKAAQPPVKPQDKPQGATPPPVKLISETRSGPEGAVFSFSYEADNGLKETKKGTAGPNGTSIMTGSYSVVMADGSSVLVEYIADENGFVAKSPALPTPPPLPAHALEQIKFAAANPTA